MARRVQYLGIRCLRKKIILSNVDYERICKFISGYRHLALDCELHMVHRTFTDIEPATLICILQTELINKARKQHGRAKKLLATFEEQARRENDCALLARLASAEGLAPMALCRMILQEKYDVRQRPQISRLLKYPHLIEDAFLAANVQQCLFSDSQEGPLIDMRRRLIGEEYELKLKRWANLVGIHFYDEQDLRRMGFDKTPDIKMILPFLYKGSVVNWIESKANFADPKSHKWNIQQQLQSYCNRFGPGIIIYWFGYHEETPNMPENNIGITVLANVPAGNDMVFMEPREPRKSRKAAKKKD